jgi:hypothetical protein
MEKVEPFCEKYHVAALVEQEGPRFGHSSRFGVFADLRKVQFF